MEQDAQTPQEIANTSDSERKVVRSPLAQAFTQTIAEWTTGWENADPEDRTPELQNRVIVGQALVSQIIHDLGEEVDSHAFHQWFQDRIGIDSPGDNAKAKALLVGVHRAGRTLPQKPIDENYNPDSDPQAEVKWQMARRVLSDLGSIKAW